MKRLLQYAIMFVAFAAMSASCSKNDEPVWNPPQDNPEEVVRTLLVYAVNRSSLRANFQDDLAEMIDAMPEIDAKKCRLLVYCTDSDTESALYQVTETEEDVYGTQLVKKFVRDKVSTDPERMSEVIDYALTLYPNSIYDLVIWGHGSSWYPKFSTHELPQNGKLYSYGGEYNPDQYSTDWMDIDEMARALPDNRFETIWFDCCYMSGIEVIYQLRDKCRIFAGYPSEVWDDGMRYDLVLPYLLREDSDAVAAAQAFYQFYSDFAMPVTIAVVDMDEIENVADAAREALHSGAEAPASSTLINYSRMTPAFYDFRQLYCAYAEENGNMQAAENLRKALEKALLYHAASDKNFNFRPWDVDNISGISAHFFKDSNSKAENYYRTLDWYKRVF